MTPSTTPTAVMIGFVTGTAVSIFGADGPSVTFLVVLGLFACAGACSRLFWDATTGGYSFRRQLGFVGISVGTSFATTLLLWRAAGVDYPTVLMGAAIVMAMLGPADALLMVRGILERVLRISEPRQEPTKPEGD